MLSFPPSQAGNLYGFIKILQRGGIELERVKRTDRKADVQIYIPFDQPYGEFAKTLLEQQRYPNLKNEKGEPIPPYDVTAHTLSLLRNIKVDHVTKKPDFISVTEFDPFYGSPRKMCKQQFSYWLYRSWIPSMDEGWTRWFFDNYGWMVPSKDALPCSDIQQRTVELNDKQIRSGIDMSTSRIIIFPDQSPSQTLNGYAKGSMPEEYVGGVGKEGVENLKKFVEAGGTLVFLNRASDFAIEQFGLPIKDVTQGLARKDFYIPGSILRTELDTTSPIAKGMPADSIAWFENGPVFEVLSSNFSLPASTEKPAEAGTQSIKIIARYPTDPAKILLSGWALGAQKIAGKAALLEVRYGKGKIVLFGFRPQYRGQSLATFPLFFNAISQ